mmetsp:Transcript_94128/g.269527  ORF Transcript_94128/g.269527 Transcript_94128/m.269527 type:complete len:126 (-) Transcript_94128:173-550(-)
MAALSGSILTLLILVATKVAAYCLVSEPDDRQCEPCQGTGYQPPGEVPQEKTGVDDDELTDAVSKETVKLEEAASTTSCDAASLTTSGAGKDLHTSTKPTSGAGNDLHIPLLSDDGGEERGDARC